MRPFRMVSLFLFLASILLLPVPVQADERPPAGTVTVTVKATPTSDYASTLLIQSSRVVRMIESAKTATSPADPEPLLFDDVDLTHDVQGRIEHYAVYRTGDLYRPADGRTLHLSVRSRLRMLGYVKGLRDAHYGRPVPWSEAERLLPRKSRFTVTDLETGLRFRVQRRAGSSHADVQPLTKEDTRIMKTIYGGRWSWNRRAILVEAPGEKPLAASMHGMPHGGDGIPGNDFNGHFCIHYAGSVTHGSDTADTAHQAMMQLAAGRLREYVQTLSPYDLTDLFLVGVNQQNPTIIKQTAASSITKSKDFPFGPDSGIERIRRTSEWEKIELKDLNQLELPVRVTIYEARKRRSESVVFSLIRSPDTGGWQIADIRVGDHKDKPQTP